MIRAMPGTPASMYIYIYLYINTHIHKYLSTYILTYIHAYIQLKKFHETVIGYAM